MNLQNNIRLLNDFCADRRFFSYAKLTNLKFKQLALLVNADAQELTLTVHDKHDYETLLWHLMPEKRTYQLLATYFKTVFVVCAKSNESSEPLNISQTISLFQNDALPRQEDPHRLGARLRRVINIALQGHIGVLPLYGDKDIRDLKRLWESGRVSQLLEKHDIIPFEDAAGETVILWKPRPLELHEHVEDLAIIVD